MFLLSEARERFEASRHKFERRRWVVRAVEASDRVETVYCAEVPGEHAFAIEDNILTGNCFGCGAHGDVIRWMTDQQGLAFMDAIKELAAEAGMEVPAADPRAARKAEAQAGLHDVMAAAQAWFVAQLDGPEGGKARAYLATRGFDAHTRARFGFGYAPEGRQALKAALGQFPEGMLIEAGLRIAVDDDHGKKREPYDRFRGRLMLPIHDARGRVIAFGGRILDAEKKDAPKYLNSPDTPLFDKGRTLYNLHRAGPVSRQSGRLLVVEGYMDAIALSAAGIGEVVAPLGTAMTETQIELAWRLVENPVLCFDGDAAGQRAAMRAAVRALPLLRPAHSLRIVRLPAGMDPDDLIKREGVAAMTRVLERSIGLADLLWEHELAAVPLDSPEAKAGLKARLLAHCDAIADQDIKALYRKDLLDRYGAFAFPRREARNETWSPPARSPQGQRGPGRKFGAPPEPTRPHEVTMARLARPAGSTRRAQALGAVAAGLVRLPQEMARATEALAVLAREDARIDLLVSMEERGEALESARIDTICAERGIAPPGQGLVREMAFRFLSEDSDAARAELAEVIDILVARPALAAALERATAAGIATDEDWREQQRLREQMRALEKRELDLQGRLGQMAGANRYNSEDEQS
ncbi:MAG: DNA primase [Sphingomonadales bacterium]|nr:DNA primase [Sphingomonadales bacterium]